MAEKQNADNWVANDVPPITPVNEQRAEAVRDGQPHGVSASERKSVKGVFYGPAPDNDEILAADRIRRRAVHKELFARKKAFDEHMKNFVPPKSA